MPVGLPTPHNDCFTRMDAFGTMHRRRHAAESPQAVLEDIACPARTRQCQHPTRKVKFGCDCTPELSRLERTPTETSVRRRLLILRRFKRPPEVLRATARGRRPRRGRSRDCLFHAAQMDTDVLCDTTISRQSYEQGCPGKKKKKAQSHRWGQPAILR